MPSAMNCPNPASRMVVIGIPTRLGPIRFWTPPHPLASDAGGDGKESAKPRHNRPDANERGYKRLPRLRKPTHDRVLQIHEELIKSSHRLRALAYRPKPACVKHRGGV